MKKWAIRVFFVAFFSFLNTAMASELVYTPVNPSFGGSSLNASWLMNQAVAQNTFTAVEEIIESSADLLADFQDSMTRRIMSTLAGRIVATAFGEADEDLGSGTYQFGDYTIDIEAIEGENISVTITDDASGQSTTIDIPYY